jgi:hypothetical protein
MDLAGKYVSVWIPGAAVDRLFTVPEGDPPSPGQWMLTGEIKGETPGVGIWLELHEMTTPTNKVRKAKTPITLLVQWNWITSALLADAEPGRRAIGFLADLKGDKS